MNPNGTWKYLRADGTYSKNTWELVDGKWYYFGGDNLMMTGWQKINGSWFYLMPSGEAFGPGWFQDTAGGNLWYYFDGDCRMLTGTINVNGVNYFMNDGSVASLPVGAWVQ